MLTEDYISFETAKLLKERGFDERCVCYYNTESLNKYGHPVFDSIDMPLSNSDLEQSDRDYVCYSAPTLQMTMKWLRKVHNLHCSVDYDYVLGWYCQITSLKETVEYDYEEMKRYHPEKDNGFSSSEEAYEAAIKYCLEKLI